jgi:hypothetical protein
MGDVGIVCEIRGRRQRTKRALASGRHVSRVVSWHTTSSAWFGRYRRGGRRIPAFWEWDVVSQVPGCDQPDLRRRVRGSRSSRLPQTANHIPLHHTRRPTTTQPVTAYPPQTQNAPNHCADFAPPSCRQLLVAARPPVCYHSTGCQPPDGLVAANLTCSPTESDSNPRVRSSLHTHMHGSRLRREN